MTERPATNKEFGGICIQYCGKSDKYYTIKNCKREHLPVRRVVCHFDLENKLVIDDILETR